MDVTKNAAASMAVARVNKFAVPRPVEEAATTAAANAQRPAFRFLEKHDADQRGGNHEMNNEEYSGQDTCLSKPE